MTFIIRPARPGDVQQIYEMAKRTGGGFTNLPPDRPSLLTKLERSAEAFERDDDQLDDDRFMFALENTATKQVRGTCQIFAKVGQKWPFYSYRIGALTQHSEELQRTFRADILNLSTDLEGATEVGGLFLHPGERSGGLGMLIARSRYLFIRMHRARFADKTIAELRGVIDDAGGSPFWDSVAGRFFGMSFQDADEFNAKHGNQFIADLMPKHPVYIAMLSEQARAVIGVPHVSGRAAMRMLENEGFSWEKYVDIFDAGPTMTVQTDRITSVRNAREIKIDVIDAPLDREKASKMLVAHGRLNDFKATYGWIIEEEGRVTLDAVAAEALGIGAGDVICAIERNAS
ncbi:arginine N-succinyltransferase [Sphingorhabdus arenilitoris]|uniref:Arginine N-succinyltransferase n=1 Tax=Sphingorhabdus arenilitoris TaxID=1490041 RepID=A0ABV8RGP0_9SPHN